MLLHFFFEILWEYIYIVLRLQVIFSTVLIQFVLLLQTKVHDLNEETSRIDASKRRVASPRVVVLDEMYRTKAEMQEAKDASRRLQSPMCSRKLSKIPRRPTFKRWRFQLKGLSISCACASADILHPYGNRRIFRIYTRVRITHTHTHTFLQWVEVETINQMIFQPNSNQNSTHVYCLHPKLQNIAPKREDCQGELLFQAPCFNVYCFF